MPDPDHVRSTQAVYDAAASRYVEFVGTEISAKTESALDRSMLTAFSELLREGPAGPVADVGCGPGRVAAFLADRGLDVVGVDVSEALLAAARRAHPSIRFELGRLDRLPLETKSIRGVVCWYSIIHTPPDQLQACFAELMRVLVPGGSVLLGFQSGEGEPVRREAALGTSTALTNYRHSERAVTTLLERAGFTTQATMVRTAALPHETTPQCFILVRRPGSNP